MATSKNDITGDSIKTKASSDAYASGWDRIFGKKTPASIMLDDMVNDGSIVGYKIISESDGEADVIVYPITPVEHINITIESTAND